MPSKKISQLAPATTPLAGTELVPIVQNGVTVKVPASDVGALFAPPLVVNANGTIGSPSGIQYVISVLGFPLVNNSTPVYNGPTTIQGKLLPSINLNESGGFTATSVDFSGSSEFNGFSVAYLSSPLTSISCSAEYIGYLFLAYNQNITNISFPNLKNVPSSIEIGGYNSPSVTYNFSSLESAATAEGNLTINVASGISGAIDNSIFPVLKSAALNIADYSGNITSLNLPSLQYLYNLGLSFGIDVYLPNVIECTSPFIASANPSPSGVFIIGTVGITKKWGDGINANTIDMSNNTLNQASVDNFLTVLASLDGTNGTTSSDNGYIYLSNLNSAPSPAGLAAKTVLEGRGWTVSTN